MTSMKTLVCPTCDETRFTAKGICARGHDYVAVPFERKPAALDKRRVYFVGSHRVGKSTLARWVRDNYGVKMVSEMARLELAERETDLANLRVDVEATTDYQRSVFERQIYVEAQIDDKERVVADRSFDNLAYMLQFGTDYNALVNSPVVQSYLKTVRERGLIFFVRPQEKLLKTDDVNKTVDWELVLRIDQTVMVLLNQMKLQYVPIESADQRERQQHLRTVLSLVGWTPIAKGGKFGSGGSPT